MPASVELKKDWTAIVNLYVPERAVAPGQACVFYQDERLLGGGWIQRNAAQ